MARYPRAIRCSLAACLKSLTQGFYAVITAMSTSLQTLDQTHLGKHSALPLNPAFVL